MGKKRANKHQAQAPPAEQVVEPVVETKEVEPTPAATAEPIAKPVAEVTEPTPEPAQSIEEERANDGERISNASTPNKEQTPIVPPKKAAKTEKPAFSVDEFALERNKIFQLVVLIATVVAQFVFFVYKHNFVQKSVLPKLQPVAERAAEFAEQVDIQHNLRAKASDFYNVSLEELDEFPVWRQVLYPRLAQAFTIAGHVATRVERYFQ